MLFRTIVIRTSNLGFVRRLIKSRLFRPLVRRFVAGETLDDGFAAARELLDLGYQISLDLLGENVSTLDEAIEAKKAYLEMIERIAAENLQDRVNISIKLTALGLDQSVEEAEKCYQELLAAAAPHSIFIRVDMESSEYTQRTIDLVDRALERFPHTGTVLQSMMKRTDEDVAHFIGKKARVRIVKGAYVEPAEVAYQDKKKVDEKYLEHACNLIKNGFYPAIATHDRKMVEGVKEFNAKNDIKPETFEWQMIYGVGRDLQRELLEQGYNVRIYIPFGTSWYPYFSRRLAERPANVFFILKSLFRG